MPENYKNRLCDAPVVTVSKVVKPEGSGPGRPRKQCATPSHTTTGATSSVGPQILRVYLPSPSPLRNIEDFTPESLSSFTLHELDQLTAGQQSSDVQMHGDDVFVDSSGDTNVMDMMNNQSGNEEDTRDSDILSSVDENGSDEDETDGARRSRAW